MKIARNLAVSEWYVEWWTPIPGSLSEGAVERSETEGVSSDGCSGLMVYSPAHINSEIFERLRSSKYTPSVTPIRACQLPQRGSRERAAPFIGVLAKPWGFGRFSSPLRNSECLTVPIHRGTLPQSRPCGRDSSLREGAGMGCVPFIGVLAEIRGYGRLSSPLREL